MSEKTTTVAPIYSVTNGNEVRFTNGASTPVKGLPVGVYEVAADMSGFYLKIKEDLELPKKIYGEDDKFVDRALAAWHKLERGIGVLLSGKSGAGKSVAAKMIGLKSKSPVLLINSFFKGSEFSDFLQKIPVKCVVIMDEFEKIYSEEDSAHLLTLLDGTSSTAHLFVLTSNDPNVNTFINSRPGRVRYHKRYDALSQDVFRAVICDQIPEGDLRDAVIKAAETIFGLSLDSLMAIINEAKMFNEPPSEFLSFLNVESDESVEFDAELRTSVLALVDNFVELEEKDKHAAAYAYSIRNIVRNSKRYGIASALDSVDEKLLKYIKEVPAFYKASFASPFQQFGPDEDDYINVQYLRAETDDTDEDNPNARVGSYSRSLTWYNREIASIIRNTDSSVLITHVDGSTLRLTPSKRSGKRMYQAF